jgi:hypothetical protein
MQEIKEAIAATRDRGFEGDAAASVASGLAKSLNGNNAGTASKQQTTVLRGFDSLDSLTSSSSDEEGE